MHVGGRENRGGHERLLENGEGRENRGFRYTEEDTERKLGNRRNGQNTDKHLYVGKNQRT
jgi:hypothetical protein